MTAEGAAALVGVGKRRRGRPILDGVTAVFLRGTLTQIRARQEVVRNTLGRLLCGQIVPDTGRVHMPGLPAPKVGAPWGFMPETPVTLGLVLRAAAHGIELGDYVAALAALMDDPGALRQPFAELTEPDRSMVLYASALLLPAGLYVLEGPPLSHMENVQTRLGPLLASRRAAAAMVWITDEKMPANLAQPDRILGFRQGRLIQRSPPV
jgi:hypothetical protein